MITLDSNPGDAPGCIKIINDDGRDILIHTDWDYPSAAEAFGWSVGDVIGKEILTCDHGGTDGTVACPKCGLPASEFIQEARQYLDDNDGATAEDPGYFERKEAI